eukprot:Pgem_evm1s8749
MQNQHQNQYIVVLRPTETVPKELNIDSVKRTAIDYHGVVIVVTCRNPLRRLNSFKTLGFEVVEISELLKPPNDKQPDIQ